ncbi:MAG: uncharacterized protein KVP18_002352 [Porospora cf. gigantea A]|uniref:uncharacterized protein n=1 Tax=Porospora cf. gigantea A TaxID=2853593 RepID=UPI00355A028F|nr:MAG: hypothetical protein KVP18_002352 [Porospora cf. gigantea A]
MLRIVILTALCVGKPLIISWNDECLAVLDADAVTQAVKNVGSNMQSDDVDHNRLMTKAKAIAEKLAGKRQQFGRRRLSAKEATTAESRDRLLGALMAATSVAGTSSEDADYLDSLVMDFVPESTGNPLLNALTAHIPCVRRVEEAPEYFLNRTVDHESRLVNTQDIPYDWINATASFSDPEAPIQWYMGSKNGRSRWNIGMNWLGAWEYMKDLPTPDPIDVVVVDSECEPMDSIRWTNYDCDTAGLDEDTDGLLDNCHGWDYFSNDNGTGLLASERTYHGTGVAGLIGSISNDNVGLAGVCEHCRVHCLKIGNDNGGSLSSLAIFKAYDYILANSDRYRISNHSYGSYTFLHAEYDAIFRLRNAGHVFVTASGNDGCRFGEGRRCMVKGQMVAGSYPAMYDIDTIVSVGATDASGKTAWFSNTGVGVSHVYAPGQDIAMASYGLPGQANDLQLKSGTSFSSPLVAAAIANAWSLFPNFEAVHIRKAVIDSAPLHEISSSRGNSGILNAEWLIRTFQSGGIAPTPDGASVLSVLLPLVGLLAFM